MALLEKCLDEAVARGVDVAAPYKPWLPVDLMQTLIVDVHEALGCSWFSAIVLACVSIRVVTLPVSVAAIRGAREKALIQPQFQALTEKQKSLSMEGDQAKVQAISKKLNAFTSKHGKFFMLKGTGNLILFQMPLYITAFAAMRGFAGHPDLFRGFAMEGPLWLDSLALADPYAFMPALTAMIMLTNTELFGSIDTEVAAVSPAADAKASNVGGQNTFQKYQKWIMRGAAVAFVPMTWNFPSGVFVFMSTNMVLSSAQNKLLRLPLLERLLELPPTADKVKEAARASRTSGPPALLPRGPPLQEKPKFWKQFHVGPLRVPVAPLDLSARGVAEHAAAQALAPRLADSLAVDRRFAVRRARPAASAE